MVVTGAWFYWIQMLLKSGSDVDSKLKMFQVARRSDSIIDSDVVVFGRYGSIVVEKDGLAKW